jgi:hypothetical protein
MILAGAAADIPLAELIADQFRKAECGRFLADHADRDH